MEGHWGGRGWVRGGGGGATVICEEMDAFLLVVKFDCFSWVFHTVIIIPFYGSNIKNE